MLSIYRAPNIGSNVAKYIDSARKWDIEYGTARLSNHITHNWVVLAFAGVPDAKMQWWQEIYNSMHGAEGSDKPRSLPPRPEDPDGLVVNNGNWKVHIQSSCRNFPSYVKYFDNEIHNKGISRTVEEHVPTLLPGIVGAAVHPVIHTGYGLEVMNGSMVADGLAYWCTRFRTICTEPPHIPPEPLWKYGGSGLIDATVRLLEESRKANLPQYAAEWGVQALEAGKIHTTGFQARVLATNDPELLFGQLLNSTGPLMLGKSLFSAVEEAVALLAASVLESDNEFFVVHGLTSLHAVLSIMPHLPDEESQCLALTYWWRAIMAILVAQNMPGLSKTKDRLARWKQARETQERTATTISTPRLLDEADRNFWTRVLHGSLDSHDEHIPKAVYALSRWAAFECFSKPTVDLFCEVAVNAVKPDPDGEGVHRNLWISSGYYDKPGEDRSRRLVPPK
eukprot:Clim_evm34s247 gene=Clim_evmTU34s247